MLVAKFGPTTGWFGKAISHENGQFVLEGYGPVSAHSVMEYDRQGHLVWANEGTRAWVGLEAQPPAVSAACTVTSASSTTRRLLNKAHRQSERGDYQSAIKTLSGLDPLARSGDKAAALGIMSLAEGIGQKVNGDLASACFDLHARSREVVEPGATARESLGRGATSFPIAVFLGSRDRPHSARDEHNWGPLWFGERWIGIGTPEGLQIEGETVPLEAVVTVEVFSGKVKKSHGERVYSAQLGWLTFGIVGVAASTALASISGTYLLVHMKNGDQAAFLIRDSKPEEVRSAVRPLLQTLGIPLRQGILVATFGSSTAWVGKTITFENELFLLEGHGPIRVEDVVEYDRQGHLVWPYEGMRGWVKARQAMHSAATATGTQTVNKEHPKEDAAPPLQTTDLVGQLAKLTELHHSGALADDEFAAFKAKLMEGRC